MFWITENHFLFVGLFDWGNAETQSSSVSWNQGGFAVTESQTRKPGTVTPLIKCTKFTTKISIKLIY